jgi:hypothetical protein
MEELIKIARDPNTDTGTRVNIYSLLVRYTSPIPKPVDDADHDHDIHAELSEEDVIAMARYVVDRHDQTTASQPDDKAKGNTPSGEESHEK